VARAAVLGVLRAEALLPRLSGTVVLLAPDAAMVLAGRVPWMQP
jgi:hypothetical protein